MKKMTGWLRLAPLIALALIPAGELIAQTGVTNAACRLYADMGNSSSVISYISKGAEVKVLESFEDYLLVEYDSTSGFVDREKVTIISGEDAIPAYVKEDEGYFTPANRQEEAIDRLTVLVNKYGPETGKALNDHKIWKGIDHNMVRDSWGKPYSITRTVDDNRITEEWYYRKATLILVDDQLVGWRSPR